MKLLLYDAMRRHLTPNLNVRQSVIEAFYRVAGPECTAVATRWDLEAVAEAHRPDVIVVLSSRIWPDVVPPLAALRARLGAVVGWWLSDDPYEIDANLDWAPLWDFIATNNRGSMPLYRGTSVLHVPFAADRQRHFRPVRQEDADYRWDIVFCGVPFPNRRALVEAAAPLLSRHKTRIIGTDWPDWPFVSRQRLSDSAFVDLYNSARIVLNLPRSLNLLNVNDFPASTPAPRTFEAAAAGGFQLVLADRPEFHAFFDIPAEMDLFFDMEDLSAKVQWYLSHPRERIAAAQQSQQRTLQNHTYDHRAATILEHAAALRQSRACSPRQQRAMRMA
jgi:spore maturation protein CgeB